ncbi:hypothetical protein HY251_14275 [bacterium]|nr:hypothetical protein [bacterium]
MRASFRRERALSAAAVVFSAASRACFSCSNAAIVRESASFLTPSAAAARAHTRIAARPDEKTAGCRLTSRSACSEAR